MVCAKPLHPQCFLNSGLYFVGFLFGEGSVAQTIEGVNQPLKGLSEASLGNLLHRPALSWLGSTWWHTFWRGRLPSLPQDKKTHPSQMMRAETAAARMNSKVIAPRS